MHAKHFGKDLTEFYGKLAVDPVRVWIEGMMNNRISNAQMAWKIPIIESPP
jgi:hypothetical protein